MVAALNDGFEEFALDNGILNGSLEVRVRNIAAVHRASFGAAARLDAQAVRVMLADSQVLWRHRRAVGGRGAATKCQG